MFLILTIVAFLFLSCTEPKYDNPDDPDNQTSSQTVSSSSEILSSSSSEVKSSSSSSVAESSSSSEEQSNIPPSSSSEEYSSSSLEGSSSSESFCADFNEGTPRLHYDQNKEQFCDVRDNNRYVFVDINGIDWMAENLKYEVGGKCGTDNTLVDTNTAYCAKYGRLYDWKTAKTACPSGWHLPSYEEWSSLIDYINNYEELKATSDWYDDGYGTDDYGFAALPGGGVFETSLTGEGYAGCWWSAEGTIGDHYIMIIHDNSNIDNSGVKGDNSNGFFSIRCVRN